MQTTAINTNPNALLDLPGFDGTLKATLPVSGAEVTITVISSRIQESGLDWCVFAYFNGIIVDGPWTGNMVSGTIRMTPGEDWEVFVDPNFEPPVRQARVAEAS